MRADARRNYDRIVEVAREVFREQGYDASLDEVAKRAGVGPGTLYRHFPKRENLLDAMMQSWMDRVDEAAEKALATEGSPRDVLLAWLASYVELISLHKGGPAKLTSAIGDDGSPIATKCRTLTSAADKVVARLAEAGALRPGMDAVTMCRLVGGVAVVADQGDLPPATVRPLLEVLADGILV
jgi:AcrR family transcriptional regulator